MNRTRTFAMSLAAAVALLGCRALDVVGTSAVTTFGVLVEKEKLSIALDSSSRSWVLTSPGDERFSWSTDFSGTPDFLVSFDAAPYISAGLDPARLPRERYSFDASAGTLTLSFEVGTDSFSYPDAPRPLDTFRKIVESHRPSSATTRPWTTTASPWETATCSSGPRTWPGTTRTWSSS